MNLPTLQFDSTPINPIDRDGVGWVTFNDLVSALYGLTWGGTSVTSGQEGGDSSVTPFEKAERAMRRIFSNNADEFTDEMTCLIKIHTGGQMREIRIFSPRGCHLLAMLAKTPKAKAFRRWVLDVLEGKASADKLAALESRLARMESALFSDRPFWPVIATCKAQGLTQKQMLDATGYRATSTIRRNLRRMERYGIMQPQLSLFKH